MKIQSSAFEHNGNIPPTYTCNGKDVNPPLQFLEVPPQTKSLVLIVDDPDAPLGTWVHWVVFNIDPSVTEVAENSVPKGGVEAQTNFGSAGYGGPCPPTGTHRYFFKLYAVDMMLDLDTHVDKEAVEEKMQSHIIAQAELIGLYRQQQ